MPNLAWKIVEEISVSKTFCGEKKLAARRYRRLIRVPGSLRNINRLQNTGFSTAGWLFTTGSGGNGYRVCVTCILRLFIYSFKELTKLVKKISNWVLACLTYYLYWVIRLLLLFFSVSPPPPPSSLNDGPGNCGWLIYGLRILCYWLSYCLIRNCNLFWHA